MQEISDYVFYVLLKNENYNQETGYSYGIKRGISKNHDGYFHQLLEMYPYDTKILRNWCDTLELLAEDGNIIIANSAIEVEEVKNRVYIIFLPSKPNLYQLNVLEKNISELSKLLVDVSLYGLKRKEFIEERLSSNFDSKEYIKKYIEDNKKDYQEKQKIKTLAG